MIEDVQEERATCVGEVCNGYDGFVYDPIEYLCSCYDDGELVKTEVLAND